MLHSKTLEELKYFPIIVKLSLTKNMQNFIVKTFHQRNAKPSENNNSPTVLCGCAACMIIFVNVL